MTDGRFDSKVLQFWQRRLSLDLRSLATARILAGIITVADVAFRALHLRQFYTEEGLVPRSVLIRVYPTLSFPSLHVANDTVYYVALLFLLHALVGLALLLGYRTRTSSVLSWLLLMSLQARNPLVLNGGDILLAALLFWGMFLPWGRVWSLDARMSVQKEQVQVFSAATVGLTFQVASLYLFAALHKLEPAWTEGSAVYYALSIESFATSHARFLLSHPQWLPWLTWSVLAFEFVALWLLISSNTTVRMIGVAGCACLHLGFGAFLDIGLFRWVPLIGLCALIPSRAWGKEVPTISDELHKSVQSFFLLSVTALTLAVNIDTLGQGRHQFVPSLLKGFSPVFASWQNWNVFTGGSLYSSGWYAIEIETHSGQHFDVWHNDQPFSVKKPTLISNDYATQRWRKWTMISGTLLKTPHLNRHVMQWWLQEWNRRHPEDTGKNLKYWYFHQPTYLDFRDAPTEKVLLGEYP